jgi:hypothetical protein
MKRFAGKQQLYLNNQGRNINCGGNPSCPIHGITAAFRAVAKTSLKESFTVASTTVANVEHGVQRLLPEKQLCFQGQQSLNSHVENSNGNQQRLNCYGT